MNKYLRFAPERDTGKTKTWGVYSVMHGDRLGGIAWYGGWRQYVFFPETGTLWNKDCLRDVATFLDEVFWGQVR